MRHGSLFSGIGGFDLAAEWMGWENIFHCEWMEFPRKVLDYHFPDADSHIDICKTDFKKYANKIDILTGGFPCQPFSTAGKRKGTDDERYLWGEMLRAIQEIKPRFVIAENVFGITNIDGGLVFEQVCLDLENEGYEVQAFIIPAASKNAPHRRDRVWFIAYSNCNERWDLCRQKTSNGGKYKTYKRFAYDGGNGIIANSNSKRLERFNLQRKGCSINWDIKGIQFRSKNKFNAANSNLSGCKDEREQSKSTTQNTRVKYSSCRWERFPIESAICSRNDGFPAKLDGITFSKWRAESIKGYGNAIVPQIAYSLFEIINEL